MPVFYVYILKCIDKTQKISYYTGSTQNLFHRFDQHLTGKGAKYTKGKQLEIVYYETFLTLKEARQREAEIKTLTQDQKINLIKKMSEAK